MFSLSFYIFSLLLVYTDCTKYKIPNITLGTLFIFLLIFGYFENSLNPYSFAISFIMLLFFIALILLMPKSIIGGGDIKYFLVICIYLEPILIPLFLLNTGITQMFFLIFYQRIKKRRVAPMAPAIFLAVVFTETLFKLGIYP